jgi:hypothetical protein
MRRGLFSSMIAPLCAAVLVVVSAAGAARAEPAKQDSRERVRASLGAKGRDLTPRFAIQGSGPMAPAMSFELRASFGEEIELLGPLAVQYRLQPEIMWQLTPLAGLRLLAGGGIGSSYIVEGGCSDTPGAPCGPGAPREAGRTPEAQSPEHVDPAFSGALGVRFDVRRIPVTALLRTDVLNAQRWATMLHLGLELPGAD